jgi:hypothetical protein
VRVAGFGVSIDGFGAGPDQRALHNNPLLHKKSGGCTKTYKPGWFICFACFENN